MYARRPESCDGPSMAKAKRAAKKATFDAGTEPRYFAPRSHYVTDWLGLPAMGIRLIGVG